MASEHEKLTANLARLLVDHRRFYAEWRDARWPATAADVRTIEETKSHD